MNRLFHSFMVAVLTGLVLFFVVLIVGLVVELGQESALQAPQGDEIWFAIRLSLVTLRIPVVKHAPVWRRCWRCWSRCRCPTS